MHYARVVIGLKVEGPFDYIIPVSLSGKIKTGSRVLVSFGFRKRVVGFVVGISKKTGIKNLKPVLDVLDDAPLAGRHLLDLARELSGYYCCSTGEIIETALPEELRRPKKISFEPAVIPEEDTGGPETGEDILVHDISGSRRWEIYMKELVGVLAQGRSAVILLPDVPLALKAKERLAAEFGSETVGVLYRKQSGELENWLKIKTGKIRVVAGTRSAVFAPVRNLGLVIVDEEQDFVYKQDQVPHYHAREAAFMRCRLEKARVILGSRSPSLEMFYLAKTGKIRYEYLQSEKCLPEIKLSDMKHVPFAERKKKPVLSRYLLDAVLSVFNTSGKTLLFLNRKGFATAAYCATCGHVLKCERCSSNLVYHFQSKKLHCHHCAFAMEPPKFCPVCHAGYIKFSGIGTEKIESEIARLIPQAKIKRPQEHAPLSAGEADIYISSEGSLRGGDADFDLIGVLSIDNLLNRIDFRAAEKTFALLSELLRYTATKIIIQTRLPRHYCFQALQEKNMELFYEEELEQRKQLRLPPFCHIAHIKLRGAKEERVKQASLELFESLSADKKSGIRVLSVNPGQPSKLRGNYYWHIVIASSKAVKISGFLKSRLKKIRYSGIIITVDVDPV